MQTNDILILGNGVKPQIWLYVDLTLAPIYRDVLATQGALPPGLLEFTWGAPPPDLFFWGESGALSFGMLVFSFSHFWFD